MLSNHPFSHSFQALVERYRKSPQILRNMEVLLCSNAAVLERLLSSAMEAIVLETAIAASKSLALSLLMIGSLPNGSDIFPKASGTTRGFPLTELHPKNVPDPENQDGSNTEDDDDDDEDDDDNDEGIDDQNGGESDEDGSGKGGDDVDDPEDEPEANGEGASDDEDEEEEDEDEHDENGDGGEEDEEEDEEEEEEEEEEIPRPPAKKRK